MFNFNNYSFVEMLHKTTVGTGHIPPKNTDNKNMTKDLYF